jgi:hypothetical protein
MATNSTFTDALNGRDVPNLLTWLQHALNVAHDNVRQ